jgi:DNA replication protein DnaC
MLQSVPIPPGCGKSHLAAALAILAVEAGYRGYFTSADDLVRTLAHSMLEGTFTHKLKTYTAPSVLVIDDVGLMPMNRTEATAFFQVVNRRYEIGNSTIVTTNRGLPNGATSSATPSSPPPFWTGSCTKPSCSTSKDRPGG